MRSEHAVCLVGQLRSLRRTAPTIRQHVLEQWLADGYVHAGRDIVTPWSVGERAPPEIHALGPRVVKWVYGLDSDIFDMRKLDLVSNAPVMARLLQQWAARSVSAQMLQRHACFLHVRRAESSAGRLYRAYLRLRLDTYLFSPLPTEFFQAFNPREAIIPEGEDYGNFAVNDVSFTDKMLGGGAAAFAADAAVWETVLQAGNGSWSRQGWIMETLTRAHLRASGVRVRLVPVAYCIMSRSGECRYKGELARSRALVPGLVRAQPESCGRFGRGRTCESEPPPLAPLSTYEVEGERMCRLWSECAEAIRLAASQPATARLSKAVREVPPKQR